MPTQTENHCHHLCYVETSRGLQPPQGAELHRQLKGAPLHAGDKLVMPDGQVLARVVDALTDFTAELTQAQCNELLSLPPMLVVCQRQPGGKVSFTRRAYAERQVMTHDGQVMPQCLVKAFGEAAWINRGRMEVLFNERQYQHAQQAGQVI